MTEASMVIVGGGKAGARAAVAFRENAWKGPVTLISDEALAPYDRPPLSKAAIMDEAEPQPVYLLDEGMMASLEVNFLRGSAVVAIDRNTRWWQEYSLRPPPYCNGRRTPAAFTSGRRARAAAARSHGFRQNTV
jgi:NAD(P)H-nitrite reductase large subunit